MRANAGPSWVFATFLATATILLTGSETKDYGQTNPTVPQPQGLLALVEKFHSHSKDFLEMADSRKGDPEFELLMYLHNTARSLEERLGAEVTIISIYGEIQCGEDRARVRPHMSAHIANDSKMIDFDIADVNNALAHTQIPAAAQLGLQMKNDLRDAKAKLNSIAASAP